MLQYGSIGLLSAHLAPDFHEHIGFLLISEMQPHILKAKAETHDADNPSYLQAMNSPHADDWWRAMKTEIQTLDVDLKSWTLVEHQLWMKVLPVTWAFRLKRFPNGLAKKFKAHFCVCDDMRIQDVDFFDTWSPIVCWSTVSLLMILSTKLGLRSAQADISAAFLHAHLNLAKTCTFINHLAPIVLVTLYCPYVVIFLRHAAKSEYFFEYLSERLQTQGLRQSNFDPCLFIGRKVIYITYVDDLLLSMLSMTQTLTTSSPTFKLMTFGSIKKAQPRGSWAFKLSVPTVPPPPVQLLHSPRKALPRASLNLLCARYTFCPTARHEQALKCIGRYLKGTTSKGLIMTPSTDLSVDGYPDADFAGLYGHEDAQDPHCAHSRTGYVILVFGCPVLWKSKLQTEIALSTMDAEYVALSQACKDLFPIMDISKELCVALGLPQSAVANMHVWIFEDIVGALTLAGLEPRCMTPQSKHYAIKYHWFHDQVAQRCIHLVKIDTKDQLGDIFTKALCTLPLPICNLFSWVGNHLKAREGV
eukprot:CCRYP_001892-RA/>CCRYP_001892-RA protein AED:0.32 eAED:0.41 QI:0/0/0/1/1/1/2/0/530